MASVVRAERDLRQAGRLREVAIEQTEDEDLPVGVTVADDVADLFYAGPDIPARETVEGLIADVGLRPMYAGADADVVDASLRLWFALVSARNAGRGMAFKVLTR